MRVGQRVKLTLPVSVAEYIVGLTTLGEETKPGEETTIPNVGVGQDQHSILGSLNRDCLVGGIEQMINLHPTGIGFPVPDDDLLERSHIYTLIWKYQNECGVYLHLSAKGTTSWVWGKAGGAAGRTEPAKIETDHAVKSFDMECERFGGLRVMHTMRVPEEKAKNAS